MSELLRPAIMKMVLTHDQNYIRAVGLLKNDWDPDEQPIYRDVLAAHDVTLARTLQKAGLIHGQIDLSNYQAVSRLLAHHPDWFSPAASQELLRPFQD